MALLLREHHVTELLNMVTAIDAIEEVLRNHAEGAATNRPRYRMQMPTSQLHVMAAGDRRMNVYGLKTYTASRKGARFLVLLYEAEGGDLLAIIEADRLGQLRTGDASGVATKFMARIDADTVGIFGSGWQAESQLMAVCAVRAIKSIKVFSRNREKCESFARRMTAMLRVNVEPVATPEEAVRGSSILITATSSRQPVFDGKWIEPGTHINAVGSNFLSKAEIDVETVRRADIIAVDSFEVARLESGDLLPAVERGIIQWDSLIDLGRIAAGQLPGRRNDKEITLFKSNGVALEDIAAALRVYNLARQRGIGEEIQLWNEES